MKYHGNTIVGEDGKSADVGEAAGKAGSPGGPFFKPVYRVLEHAGVFTIDIEPEKDVVLILSEVNQTDPIIEIIVTDLGMDEPGNGFFLFGTQ